MLLNTVVVTAKNMKGRIVICYQDSSCLTDIEEFIQENFGKQIVCNVLVDKECSNKEELKHVVGGRTDEWPIVFFNNDPIAWKALQHVVRLFFFIVNLPYESLCE